MLYKNGWGNKIYGIAVDKIKALGNFIILMLNNMDYVDALEYLLFVVGLLAIGFGMITWMWLVIDSLGM